MVRSGEGPALVASLFPRAVGQGVSSTRSSISWELALQKFRVLALRLEFTNSARTSSLKQACLSFIAEYIYVLYYEFETGILDLAIPMRLLAKILFCFLTFFILVPCKQ